MLDGNGIKGFETVDQANGIVVRRVGALVYTGIHLHLNNLTNFVIDTWWYQNVLLNPGGVCDDGDFDRQEEVLAEVTALGVVPSEPSFWRDMK